MPGASLMTWLATHMTLGHQSGSPFSLYIQTSGLCVRAPGRDAATIPQASPVVCGHMGWFLSSGMLVIAPSS